jgi:hypothetical protein
MSSSHERGRYKMRLTAQKVFAVRGSRQTRSKVMKPNMKPDTILELEAVRVLRDDELDIVTGGAAQVWVSLMVIHGFNPQPDPPAVGLLPAVQTASHQ